MYRRQGESPVRGRSADPPQDSCHRGASEDQTMDLTGTGVAEGRRRRRQRRSGREHVIAHHDDLRCAGHGVELDPDDALGTSAAGLMRSCRSSQHAPNRRPRGTTDGPGDLLGLIEAPTPPPSIGRGCPGEHRRRETGTDLGDEVGEGTGEVRGDGPHPPVLQRGDERSRRVVVPEQCRERVESRRDAEGIGGHESVEARGARGGPVDSAPRAPDGQPEVEELSEDSTGPDAHRMDGREAVGAPPGPFVPDPPRTRPIPSLLARRLLSA